MCKTLPRGTTVNCDNWYTSVNAAIKLKRTYGVFIRGTVRGNRKLIPKKIILNRKQKNVRGFRKLAVNQEHGIVAVSWMDKRPVIFLSTADGTEESTVKRQQGNRKVIVPAPQCVEQYTKCMGGVDRHDQLRHKYSLHSRHHFKKYYVGLYLCLFDIALTNAYLCYKLNNPEICNQHESRADFLENIATTLCSNDTKWMDSCMDDPHADIDSPAPDDDEVLYDLEILGSSPLKRKSTDPTVKNSCNIQMFGSEKPRSHEGRGCQICLLELRTPVAKIVGYCPLHKIRLCTAIRSENDGPELDWMCPNRDWSCSQKFHEFYLQRRVFGTVGMKRSFVTILKKSAIAMARKEYIEKNQDQIPARVARRRKTNRGIDGSDDSLTA